MKITKYRHLFSTFLCLPILLLFLSSCVATQNRYILLWHSWNENDSAALETVLERFSEIHPSIRVVTVAVPTDSLKERYQETAVSGLGPDVVIGTNDWLIPFAESNLIRNIGSEATEGIHFEQVALSSLQYKDGIYGLPLAMRTTVLYYNLEQVENPATTLEDLKKQAASAQTVAMSTRFEQSFWGIRAFGANPFDPKGDDAQQFQQSLARWFVWLQQAQDSPGMILGSDPVVLRQLFMDGKAAYYIGEPEELILLQEALGQPVVGVARLPNGPDGPAGPLLRVESLYFNSASSVRQQEAALTLGRFLTNTEQGSLFMRETNRVSANQRVGIDSRTFPIMAGFSAQIKTAILTPQDSSWRRFVVRGEEAIIKVLTGEENAGTAACIFLEEIGQPKCN